MYLSYPKGAANKSAGADTRNAGAAIEQCATDGGGAYPVAARPNAANGAGSQIDLTCGTGTIQKLNVSPNNVLTHAPATGGKTYTILTQRNVVPDGVSAGARWSG